MSKGNLAGEDLSRALYQLNPGPIRILLNGARDRLPLPARHAPLVGRHHEISAVAALLRRPNVRLVTLIGSGGVGKTRLALHAADRAVDSFADGSSFVSLAAVSDPALVGVAIARALGVVETDGPPPLEMITALLRHRQHLLILDNFEQITPAAVFLAEVLTNCPRVTALVTSRSLLRVSGEYAYPVPPLSLPSRQVVPHLTTLMRSDAVRLFIMRARAVAPTFAVNDETVVQIAEICHSLDGLPLAIELAAARVNQFPLLTLQRHLSQRLAFLTGGAKDQPTRLRSLREAIAWSYDLLNPSEQTWARRLAVFTGGFTLLAAAAICNGDGGESESADMIAALIDKSFILATEPVAGEPRYRMLETIREYGLEQLIAMGELRCTRAAHAQYYLALATDRGGFTGREQRRWLDRIGAEQDNLLAALTWAEEVGDIMFAVKLCGYLAPYWSISGRLREGRAWLRKVLGADRRPNVPAVALVPALIGDGTLAWAQGDIPSARARGLEAIALADAAGDTLMGGAARQMLGVVAMADRDEDRAALYFAAAAERFEQTGAVWGLVQALTELGNLDIINNRLPRARVRMERALALGQDISYSWGIALALYRLGLLHIAEGDAALAAGPFRQSLSTFARLGDMLYISMPLAGLATVAIAGRDASLATRLAGAAEAIRTAVGGTVRWAAPQDTSKVAKTARTMLGEAAFAKAWREGYDMSLTAVLALALETVSGATLPNPSPVARRLGLTRREIEVLRLLAERRSDCEIAEALFISPRTATRHVANIRKKLDVGSRRAAVVIAHRLHLLDT